MHIASIDGWVEIWCCNEREKLNEMEIYGSWYFRVCLCVWKNFHQLCEWVNYCVCLRERNFISFFFILITRIVIAPLRILLVTWKLRTNHSNASWISNRRKNDLTKLLWRRRRWPTSDGQFGIVSKDPNTDMLLLLFIHLL